MDEDRLYGEIAQLVEQRTENPCVGGSIPPLATSLLHRINVPFYSIKRIDNGFENKSHSF